MTINSTPHQIETVFGTQYFIDFYQRDYKWTQPQVEAVLDDIFFKFDADYHPEHDATQDSISKYGWYYLNTFVTNEENGRKFIVDGQQRLTTLTLIIIKLVHLCRGHGLVELEEWLKTKIYGAYAEGKTFWMSANGRAGALQDLYDHDAEASLSEPDSAPLSIRNLYGNYGHITRYLDAKLTDAHKLKAFVLYFMKRIQLVELHINDSRDVAMVFEVINDRGERLQPYEVFKGELLGQLAEDEVDRDYLDLWTAAIDPLQDRDSKEPDRFFQLLFRSRHVDNRNEYRDFDGDYQRQVFSQKWDGRLRLKRNPLGVKEFLRCDVRWYAALYRDLLALNGKEGTHLYFNGTLNSQDRQFLLIMSAISVDDNERDRKIKLVARLFDRNYSLLQLTRSYNSNRFTESIIDLNTAIRNQSCDAIQEAFDRQLLQDIKEVTGVTTDDPFLWSLFRSTGYWLGSRFLRYFFARAERFISEQAKLSPIDGYWNLVRNNGVKYGYHIEHILADNSENRMLFNGDEEAFIQQRNRLGALLLLRGADNQSSRNELYSEKLKTYSHAPRLAASLCSDFYHSNPSFKQMIQQHGLNFRPLATFGVDEIEERHALYFDMAKLIWGDESFPKRAT